MATTLNELYNSAVHYHALGYSVIPVYGLASPDRFKQAAVRWAPYQTRLASPQTLKHWFLEQQYGGIAIVCGSVSGLAVLDFDDEQLAALFAATHPDLIQTYTVRSGKRGLPHLYFRVPQHLSTRSRSSKGVDWQYNGRYVIAAPTSSDGGAWTVECDVTPRFLTEVDLSRIMAFMDAISHIGRENGAVSASVRNNPIPDDAAPSAKRLIAYYQARVHQGRNNALFEACCWLRDSGGTLEDASVLVPVHVQQAPVGTHPPESPEKRRSEALRTIASAFSRSPSHRKKPKLTTLPNTLREAMLKYKQTPLLRVLEVIIKSGWRVGQCFTRLELLERVREVGIGDYSLRKALAATCPDEKPIFAEAATAASAAGDCGDESPELNAIKLSGTQPTQKRGRPSVTYLVPDLHEVCQRYGVEWKGGDDIDLSALNSAARYRQAVHTALFERRPGQYSRTWLARRLGVSARTVRRYNLAVDVTVTPMFHDQPLTWRTLSALAEDELYSKRYGAFLQDETGKRYPPLLPVARKLLSQKRMVTFSRQLPNHYTMTPAHAPPVADTASRAAPLHSPPQAAQPPLLAPTSTPDAQDAHATSLPGPMITRSSSAADAAEHTALRPLTEAEDAVAQRLHALGQGKLSLRRARSLVREYGRFAVSDVAETLHLRGDTVKNPAGFATSLLQSRYGRDVMGRLNGGNTLLAETLYMTVEWHNPQRKLQWKQCLQLTHEYGPSALSQVITLMNEQPQGSLVNPAGYAISRLREGRGQATSSKPSAERAVRALMDTTRSISPKHAIAKAKAQALVKQYGAKAVMRAVRVVGSRSNITNPTGFVITYLRSEQKGRKKRQKR